MYLIFKYNECIPKNFWLFKCWLIIYLLKNNECLFSWNFNMYLVCFNKYDHNKIIKHYIFNWHIINFLLCFILSWTIIRYYFVFCVVLYFLFSISHFFTKQIKAKFFRVLHERMKCENEHNFSFLLKALVVRGTYYVGFVAHARFREKMWKYSFVYTNIFAKFGIFSQKCMKRKIMGVEAVFCLFLLKFSQKFCFF